MSNIDKIVKATLYLQAINSQNKCIADVYVHEAAHAFNLAFEECIKIRYSIQN